MEEALFDYQRDAADYVQKAAFVYGVLADGVKKYCGGVSGKTMLDVGAGFHLAHGGLNLSLALRDGARQCFGIDIASWDDHASRPDKLAFWKAAVAELGVVCHGLAEGHAFLGTQNVLHYDDFVSKIVCLQMSASNMYFRDNMFDLMISNAVFEHVKRPKAVLQEMFRVMAPGGHAYINWNPYTGLEMGGHDIGIPFHYPWAHLRTTEDQHVRLLREVFSDPKLYKTAFPPEHTPTDERIPAILADVRQFRLAYSADLNKMRIGEFLGYAAEAGFEIVQSGHLIRDEHRHYLTDEIRKELPGYGDDELLTILHTAVLRKKMTAGDRVRRQTDLMKRAGRRISRFAGRVRRRLARMR